MKYGGRNFYEMTDLLKNLIDQFNEQEARLARCNNAEAIVVELEAFNDNESFNDAA